MAAGSCRVCGCSDLAPCVVDEATGDVVDVADDDDAISKIVFRGGVTVCSWIEVDLCSACVNAPAPPPLLFDAYGQPYRRGAP